MSGVPAIDTRSNNNCIKHKINTKREQKVKQTKKQKHVAVRVGRFFRFMFALFLLYFRTFFRFVFAFFLGAYSKYCWRVKVLISAEVAPGKKQEKKA